jgi:hypothetical protein
MNAQRPIRTGSAGRDGRYVLEQLARLLARQAVTDQCRSAPAVSQQNTKSSYVTTPRSSEADRPIDNATPLGSPQGKGGSNV